MFHTLRNTLTSIPALIVYLSTVILLALCALLLLLGVTPQWWAGAPLLVLTVASYLSLTYIVFSKQIFSYGPWFVYPIYFLVLCLAILDMTRWIAYFNNVSLNSPYLAIARIVLTVALPALLLSAGIYRKFRIKVTTRV